MIRLTSLTRFNDSDLKPGEKIILRVRRHWFSFFSSALPSMLKMLVIIGIGVVLAYFDVITLEFNYENLFLWGLLIGLILWQFFGDWLKAWIDWRYDEDIITTERIVDVDQHHLFGRDVGITELDNVEDISLKHKGFFSTIFNFADVDIQTAGTNTQKLEGGNTFVLKDAPNPLKIQKIISEAVINSREKQYKDEEKLLKDIIHERQQ